MTHRESRSLTKIKATLLESSKESEAENSEKFKVSAFVGGDPQTDHWKMKKVAPAIKTFGEALARARLKRDSTQDEMADLLRVNRVTYARWETGKKFPSFLEADRVCRVLGIKYSLGQPPSSTKFILDTTTVSTTGIPSDMLSIDEGGCEYVWTGAVWLRPVNSVSKEHVQFASVNRFYGWYEPFEGMLKNLGIKPLEDSDQLWYDWYDEISDCGRFLLSVEGGEIIRIDPLPAILDYENTPSYKLIKQEIFTIREELGLQPFPSEIGEEEFLVYPYKQEDNSNQNYGVAIENLSDDWSIQKFPLLKNLVVDQKVRADLARALDRIS